MRYRTRHHRRWHYPYWLCLLLTIAVLPTPSFAAWSCAGEAPCEGDEALVAFLYQQLLGREATAAEVAVALTQLSQGEPAALVMALLEGDDFQTLVEPVAGLYFAAFDRLPDGDGLHYWVGEYRLRGGSAAAYQAIASDFASAPEFQLRFALDLSDEAFIDQLYYNVLRRPADPAGQQYWLAVLLASGERGLMVAEFARSLENRANAAQAIRLLVLFNALLGRDPDEAEMIAASNQAHLAAVVEQLLASSEYIGPLPGGDNLNLDCDLSSFEAEVLHLLNAARAQARRCGTQQYPTAAPLRLRCELTTAAREHALDMGSNGYFSHTGRDGSSPEERIARTGYDLRTWGENIAAGYPSPQAVMAGWLDSAGHCANLMDASFSEVGIAAVEVVGSNYGLYWVQLFAAPR